jgi:uncharacterized membrane protein
MERRNNRPVAVRFDKTMKEAHLLDAAMPYSEGACSRIMGKTCVVSKTLLFENQLNWCEFRTIIIVVITITTCNMTTITRRRVQTQFPKRRLRQLTLKITLLLLITHCHETLHSV